MSKTKKIVIALISLVVLVAVFIIGAFARIALKDAKPGALYGNTSSLAPTENRQFVEGDPNAPEGMVKISENDSLTLFMNLKDTKFAVYEKDTGKLWHSNPTDYDSDSIALATVKNRLQSQVSIKYFNEKSQDRTKESYGDSVLLNQFSIEAIANGVRVTYTLGKRNVVIAMLPKVVAKDKFEEKILNVVDEKSKTDLLKYYKLVRVADLPEHKRGMYTVPYKKLDIEKEFYFLDAYVPQWHLEMLYTAIFENEKSTYTIYDMKDDNELQGLDTDIPEVEQFVVPVEYTISGDAFYANVPVSAIEIPETYTLTEIRLLEFFGATGLSDNGYMLVPDGSGALVNFNNGKIDAPLYQVDVYGADETFQEKESGNIETSAVFPVFGICRQDSAMFAIIEDGEAHAQICTDISGKTHCYNQTYASFTIRPYDVMKIQTNNGLVYNNRYQGEAYQGYLKVRYNFMNENEANYFGMASYYKDYLLDNGLIAKRNTSDIPFVLELLGQIKTKKSFMGIVFDSTEAVTTFDQASEILDILNQKNIKNVDVKYSSWFSGGIYHDVPTDASPSGQMGGKADLSDLSSAAATLGASVYMNASVSNVYGSFPSFNQFSYATRFAFNQIASKKFYNVATLTAEQEAGKYFKLSARYLLDYVGQYVKSVNKTAIKNVWFDDLANDLNSDFRKNKDVDRQVAIELIKETLDDVSKKVDKIGLDGANLYALKYADKLINMPLTTSGNRMEDEVVPFVQIVLSGIMPYTGSAINISGQDRTDMLKAVETGAGLHFKWIYSSNLEIKDLEGRESRELFSLYYQDWIDIAADFYGRMQNEMGNMIGTEIIAHEKLEYQVYKTTYETGYVIVNYNPTAVVIDGVEIGAMDFKAFQN